MTTKQEGLYIVLDGAQKLIAMVPLMRPDVLAAVAAAVQYIDPDFSVEIHRPEDGEFNLCTPKEHKIQ